ncbi:hypothetical protein BH23PSE1_BH23PSE1_14920 [soil metagenome]
MTAVTSFTRLSLAAIMLPLAATLAAGPAAAQEAGTERQRTVVEQRLAEANLCGGLRTEQLGQTIGIDVLEDVEVREADVSLRGDDLALSLAGRLACRSSDDSIIAGNASADVAARAELLLSDCTISALDLDVENFGGSFGTALSAFAPQIEQALADEARSLLLCACRQLGDRDRG